MMMIIVLFKKFTYKFWNQTKQNISIFFKNHENNGLKNLKCQKTFIEYSSNMQGVYENIQEYNSSRIHILLE